ncbi:MAG: hypothetical protein JKP97_18675 [Rhodobacteraceae bacterium]|jgi:hypothetical protein|nr:hypothetical protein [Paracoccaceae bacterium]
MRHDELTSRIIAFARHCGDTTPPEHAARRRGWIDAQGAPTADGRALLCALREQEATRTVFRGAIV